MLWSMLYLSWMQNSTRRFRPSLVLELLGIVVHWVLASLSSSLASVFQIEVFSVELTFSTSENTKTGLHHDQFFQTNIHSLILDRLASDFHMSKDLKSLLSNLCLKVSLFMPSSFIFWRNIHALLICEKSAWIRWNLSLERYLLKLPDWLCFLHDTSVPLRQWSISFFIICRKFLLLKLLGLIIGHIQIYDGVSPWFNYPIYHCGVFVFLIILFILAFLYYPTFL